MIFWHDLNMTTAHMQTKRSFHCYWLMKHVRKLYLKMTVSLQNIRNTFITLSCTPQLCQVAWMPDHSWCTQETVECEKPSSVAVLDTLKPMRLATTTIPFSKAPCEWHTYTIHVSRLKSPPLTCLLHFLYTDWSGLNKWHEGIIVSPGLTWSVYVMERAVIPNVLYTQCMLLCWCGGRWPPHWQSDLINW